ncbi:MAG: FAD-dependent oxidoreductase [Desulfoplanes sp.]|nr:FAD-dependent oxidoreductase [Desulfoplanes sp.]MDD4648406.1 FAD-dependent oxidoreductase [Desulfoplanes sp.]
MKVYDAVVIGGGPAGVTAALYLARAGVSLAWIEKLAPGGQVLSTEVIDNYPGFPKGIKGYELADLFEAHLDGYEMDRYHDEVFEVQAEPGEHRIKVGEEWITARSLAVCTGARWRKLGIEGEERFAGKGVSYCALCDGNFFRGQDVACIGGGNTALEESLYLAKMVNKIYLVHRRDCFRGDRVYQDKVMSHPKIELVLHAVPQSFIGGDEGLTGLVVQDVRTGKVKTLPVAGAFIFIGQDPEARFLPSILNRDASGFLLTDMSMQTNIPGIFAAGDICSKACRQVATAVGDGATAAHSIRLYLEKLNA